MLTHLEDAVALLCPELCRVLPCCSSASLLTSEQAVAASFAALRRCSFEMSRHAQVEALLFREYTISAENRGHQVRA